MTRLAIAIVVCCAFPLTVIAVLIPVNPSGNGDLRVPSLIGENALKRFYVDKDVSLTWAEAKAYCKTQTTPAPAPVPMKLAFITATAAAPAKSDYEVLTGDIAKGLLGNGKIYWTSGRDAQAWKQFVWDLDADETASSIGAWTNPGALPFFATGPRTCVAFMIMKDGLNGRLAGLDCTAKYPVLCQNP